jgi:DNA-binding transcriptional LysR family regulator
VITDVRNVDLSRREADVAIRLGPTAQVGLVTKKVCAVGFGLYGAASYMASRAEPREPRDLAAYDLLGYEEGVAATPEEQWIATAAAGAVFALRSNSTNLIHAAIHAGLGVGMLRCWLGDADCTLTRLLPREAYVTRDLSLVIHPDSRRTARIRLIFDALDALFLEHKATLAGVESGKSPAKRTA